MSGITERQLFHGYGVVYSSASEVASGSSGPASEVIDDREKERPNEYEARTGEITVRASELPRKAATGRYTESLAVKPRLGKRLLPAK